MAQNRLRLLTLGFIFLSEALASNETSPEPVGRNTTACASFHRLVNVLMYVFAALAIVGLIVNLLVLLTLWQTVDQGGHSASIFANLAFVDSVLCALLLFSVFGMNSNLCLAPDNVICIVWLNMALMFAVCSIYSVTAVSLDRFMGVVHPLQRTMLIKSNGAFKVILSVWFLSLIVSMPVWGGLATLSGNKDMDFAECHFHQPLWYLVTVIVFVFLLPFCIMSEAYRRVNHRVKSRSRMIATGIMSNAGSTTTDVIPLRVHQGRRGSAFPSSTKKSPSPQFQYDLAARRNTECGGTILASLRGTENIVPSLKNSSLTALSSRVQPAPHGAHATTPMSPTESHNSVLPSSAQQSAAKSLGTTSSSRQTSSPVPEDPAHKAASTRRKATIPTEQKTARDVTVSMFEGYGSAIPSGSNRLEAEETGLDVSLPDPSSFLELPRFQRPRKSWPSERPASRYNPVTNTAGVLRAPELTPGAGTNKAHPKKGLAQGSKSCLSQRSGSTAVCAQVHGESASGEYLCCSLTRTAVTLTLILTSFVLFWTPFFVMLLVCHLTSWKKVPTGQGGWCHGSVLWAMCHSLINPFMYTWPRAEYRRTLSRVLQLKRVRRLIHPSVPSIKITRTAGLMASDDR